MSPGKRTNLAVKLGYPVPLGLVQSHGGPHALIAAVIAASPAWKRERSKVKVEFGSQIIRAGIQELQPSGKSIN